MSCRDARKLSGSLLAVPAEASVLIRRRPASIIGIGGSHGNPLRSSWRTISSARLLDGGRRLRCRCHAADQAAQGIPTVRKAEAHQDPDDRHDPNGYEALHHDGQDVLVADQPAVKEGQTGRHKHDQGGAYEH